MTKVEENNLMLRALCEERGLDLRQILRKERVPILRKTNVRVVSADDPTSEQARWIHSTRGLRGLLRRAIDHKTNRGGLFHIEDAMAAAPKALEQSITGALSTMVRQWQVEAVPTKGRQAYRTHPRWLLKRISRRAA